MSALSYFLRRWVKATSWWAGFPDAQHRENEGGVRGFDGAPKRCVDSELLGDGLGLRPSLCVDNDVASVGEDREDYGCERT